MKTINNIHSVGVQDCEVISWGELCARKLPAGTCFEVQCLGWMCSSSLVWYPTIGTSIKQPPCPKLPADNPEALWEFLVTSWHLWCSKGQHPRALRGWSALVAILWRCKRQELCRSRGFSANLSDWPGTYDELPWFQFKASQVFLQRFDEVPGVEGCQLGTFGAFPLPNLGRALLFFFRPNRFPIFTWKHWM